jgi:hypothetical protein
MSPSILEVIICTPFSTSKIKMDRGLENLKKAQKIEEFSTK